MRPVQYYDEEVRRKFQRPGHCADGLRSRPWWPREEFEVVHELEKNFSAIKQEFIDLVLTGRLKFHPESPGGPRKALATGAWKIFELWSAGRKNPENCAEAPTTARILDRFEDITSNARGLAYFSVVGGGGTVRPHCGPTNARLRIHLGISIPDESWLRVGPEVRKWKEGECLVFDDSWEHEVGNESPKNRGVLIVDVWHPDASDDLRRSLTMGRRKRQRRTQPQNRARAGWLRPARELA